MEMIAYCGLDCESCPAFIAYKTDDQALREKTAKEWASEHDMEIKPEDVNCTGCTGTGIKISWCSDGCPIRKCGIEMKVENCGHCAQYPCDTLAFIVDNVPDAKQRLDQISKG